MRVDMEAIFGEQSFKFRKIEEGKGWNTSKTLNKTAINAVKRFVIFLFGF